MRTLAFMLGSILLAATCQAQGFWNPPTVVPEVSSSVSDYYPFISGDLQTIRVASSRNDLPAPPAPAGGWHIWYAQRTTRYGTFGPMIFEPGAVQTPQNDLAPWVMPDNLTMYAATNASLPGNVGGFDINEWTRPTASSPWVFSTNVTAVNGPSTDYMPGVTSDGLEIYITGSSTIVMSKRSSPTAPWSPRTTVTALAGHGHSGISMNGLEIYTAQGGKLYATKRPSRSDPWGTPQALGPINNNTSGSNNRPTLAIDGRELFFSSSRPANTPGVGSVSVWTSRWTGLSIEGRPLIGKAMKIHLTLPLKAGSFYQVAMAFTNTGIPVPRVGTIPLAIDNLLLTSVQGTLPQVFQNFAGTLNVLGEATAQLNTPNIGALVGFPFELAAVTITGPAIDYISNGISLKFDV